MTNSPLYHWYGYNDLAFQLINNLGDSRMDVFMRLGSVVGNPRWLFLFAVGVIAVGIYRGYKHASKSQWSDVARWAITLVTTVLTFATGLFVIAYVNQVIVVDSPMQALGAGAVRLIGEGPGSAHRFLSGQAFFATGLFVALWLSLAVHQRVAGCLIVAWIALSRIYVGAQFPADVAAAVLSAWVLAYTMRGLAMAVVPRVVGWWAGKLAHRARLR